MDTTVRETSSKDIITLRWNVLRKGRPRESAVLPGDELDSTHHYAIFRGDRPIGCVTIMKAPCPEDPRRGWQLRGMAVADEAQGFGVGRALLSRVERDFPVGLWCNARDAAVPFYTRCGWSAQDVHFDIPQVGPHTRMWGADHTAWKGRYLEVAYAGRWEFVRRGNATGVVIVVPLTADGEIVLVEQYRPPLGTQVIELPAGLFGDLGPDEAPSLAAARELEEETGFTSDDWLQLCVGPVSSGLTDTQKSFFLARSVVKTSPGGGVEGESIRTHVVPLSALDNFLADCRERGAAVDPNLFVGLWFVSRHAPQGVWTRSRK